MVKPGAGAAISAAVLCGLLIGCAALPANQERDLVARSLEAMTDVTLVNIGCGGSVLATNTVCADVVMKDGARFRFERAGLDSFGSTATNVVVAKAGPLEPRVASCAGVGPPNFHRSGALGHHFNPTLLDV